MAKIYLSSLSSTYKDLKECRRVVFETWRKISGYHALAMGNYIATDPRPVEQGLKDVEKAALYVELFAFRYGCVPPASHDNPKGLLITELKFRRAEALCRPCLIVEVKDTTLGLHGLLLRTSSEDKGPRINTLRQYLNHFNATTGEP